MRKFILAVLAVFVAWSILDFIIHGVAGYTCIEIK